MMTYDDFKSKRPDGRVYSPWAVHMEHMRKLKFGLEFNPDMTKEEFLEWQGKVKEKAIEILKMPKATPQPEPKMISSIKRDTYTVEKWEYYPDDYLVIPFLILIPDTATKENPAPTVLCYPGSCNNKEELAGEPLIEEKHMCNWHTNYPDDNKMAYHMVKNGMVAFAFDNPETAESGMDVVGPLGYTRVQLCYGYLQEGFNYVGMTVFYRMQIMEFIKSREYVDTDRIAISSHSLGTEAGIFQSILCDDIKGLVFNNALREHRHNYVCLTEYDDIEYMVNAIGNWHIVPEIFRWFDWPDLCAALAPKFLALTEGGAEYYLEKVQKAYEIMGVPENYLVSHFPKYADEASRNYHGKPKDYGLTTEDFDEIHYIDVEKHAFKAEPALKHIKKCFGME